MEGPEGPEGPQEGSWHDRGKRATGGGADSKPLRASDGINVWRIRTPVMGIQIYSTSPPPDTPLSCT